MTLTAWEAAARQFEPPPPPRFASPLDYGAVVMPKMIRTPALELINSELVDVQQGHVDRLIITMAPQEAKSSTGTRFFIGSSLCRNPEARWGIASYSDRLARGWSRRIRNDITGNSGRLGAEDLGLRLAPDQKAADEWKLDNGIGGVYAAGIHGSWSGVPLDGLVIDDPHKDRADADSFIRRGAVWDWFTSAATARLAPGAPIVLILTPWHWDDLRGKILRAHPGEWKLIHIPAQADPKVIDPDPLGRRPGEYMVSARGRTTAQWEKRKREAADEWTPLYQGSPSAAGGDVFDVSKLRRWRWNRDRTAVVVGDREWRLDPETRDLWVFITADTASSTRTSADWTVISVWAVALDGALLLLDVVRARKPPHQQLDLARPLVDRWSPAYVYVEPSLRSTQFIREAVGAGWKIRDLVADSDKLTRAMPAARRVQHGEVVFPSGPDGIEADGDLLDYFVEEMKQFPAGRWDDAVDTLSYAARVQWEDYLPPTDSAPPPPPPGRDPWNAATDVPPGFDPGSAQW